VTKIPCCAGVMVSAGSGNIYRNMVMALFIYHLSSVSNLHLILSNLLLLVRLDVDLWLWVIKSLALGAKSLALGPKSLVTSRVILRDTSIAGYDLAHINVCFIRCLFNSKNCAGPAALPEVCAILNAVLFMYSFIQLFIWNKK